jgi:hypothetical protein
MSKTYFNNAPGLISRFCINALTSAKPNCQRHHSKKKASTREALALLSVSSLTRESLPESGAKVKKEAENSSIHACVTLISLGLPVNLAPHW